MDKTDTIQTRTGGLGSSDAKMIAQIGRNGSIPESSRKRIAIMLGLDEQVQFSTKATENGNFIEDCIFEELKKSYPEAVSNPYYESSILSKKYGFKVFNHIDFEVVKNDTLYWFENKATNHETTDSVILDYCDQLGFHYMLGIEKAKELKLKFILFVSHYKTETKELVFNAENMEIKAFTPYSQAELYNGLQIISEAIEDFQYEKKEEFQVSDLPEVWQNEIMEVSIILRQIDDQKKKVDSFKERILEIMQDGNVKSIKNDFFNLTYVAPTTSILFDKDKLKSDLPEVFEKYNTKKTNKKAFLKLTLK